MPEVKKIVIICGGTGGHFYPGLTVARKFAEQGGAVELFLSGKHAGKQAETAEVFGIESTLLPDIAAPGGISGKLRFLLKLPSAVLKSFTALKHEKPDAVLGMGSFTSLPTMLAARMLKIPIFLHDGNARVGRANVFLSSWAEKILLAFPPVNAEMLKAQYTVTGMPVRPELNPEKYGTIPKNELIKIFNDEFCAEFSHEKPIALVFGGSQGALVFNEIFPEGAIKTDSDAFQVIHLAGSGNDAEVQIKYKNAKFASKVIDSTEKMTLLYSLADIIFCRSGGSTVAELALFAKFAVLVPYPFATDNHQSANADYYVSSGAGIKLENSECSPAKFAELLSDFLKNPAKFAEFAAQGAKLAKPNAAEAVIKEITE